MKNVPGPTEADLLDLGAEAAEDIEGEQRIAAHFRIDLLVVEVEGIGDLHPLDTGGRERQLDEGSDRVVVEGMRPRGDGLHQRRVGDGPCHRSAVIEAVEVGGRAIGIAAVRRLETDDAALGRRNADRAADVGAGRQGGDPRRQRSTRAAGGSARRIVGIPRVAGDAPDARLGDARQAEFRCRRPGEDVGAGHLQALDHRVGMIIDRILEDQRAMGGALAREPLGIFHRERNAVERCEPGAAPHVAGFGRLGLVHGLVEIAVGKAVDRRIDPLGPFNDRRHQFARTELAGPEQVQRRGCGEITQVVVAHGQGSRRGASDRPAI